MTVSVCTQPNKRQPKRAIPIHRDAILDEKGIDPDVENFLK